MKRSELEAANQIKEIFKTHDPNGIDVIVSGESLLIRACDGTERNAAGHYSEIQQIAIRSAGDLEVFWNALENLGLICFQKLP
jgi:hypothetical protein